MSTPLTLPLSASERKKAEANENTFVVRPPIRQRFPVPVVTDIIKRIMTERLPPDAKYSSELGKEIADAVKNEVRDLGLPRYKIMVHVTVGENKGEGIRVGTRCLWDNVTDNLASYSLQNDSLVALCTVYGAYLY